MNLGTMPFRGGRRRSRPPSLLDCSILLVEGSSTSTEYPTVFSLGSLSQRGYFGTLIPGAWALTGGFSSGICVGYGITGTRTFLPTNPKRRRASSLVVSFAVEEFARVSDSFFEHQWILCLLRGGN
ncbi:hypothetical protein K1719_015880 [Acacia pycnantha]|nr:hypothetical protein K1719_015880 [Acacia pycnantha]